MQYVYHTILEFAINSLWLASDLQLVLLNFWLAIFVKNVYALFEEHIGIDYLTYIWSLYVTPIKLILPPSKFYPWIQPSFNMTLTSSKPKNPTGATCKMCLKKYYLQWYLLWKYFQIKMYYRSHWTVGWV